MSFGCRRATRCRRWRAAAASLARRGVGKTGKEASLPRAPAEGRPAGEEDRRQQAASPSRSRSTAASWPDGSGRAHEGVDGPDGVPREGRLRAPVHGVPPSKAPATGDIRRVGLEVVAGSSRRPRAAGVARAVHAVRVERGRRRAQTTESQGIVPLPSYLTIAPARQGDGRAGHRGAVDGDALAERAAGRTQDPHPAHLRPDAASDDRRREDEQERPLHVPHEGTDRRQGATTSRPGRSRSPASA